MNEYLKNLEKIEFVITYACSGKCRHCSEGDHSRTGEKINGEKAAETVKSLAKYYNLKTVMTFGGEPLLYPECVYPIMLAAKEMNIPRRQLITNGYFSKAENEIKKVAKTLSEIGVNDVLLSVDAFHQETIPLETVKRFAESLKANNVPLRLQPAWLVSKDADNIYNQKTRELLNSFSYLGINENDGNIIFPEGNAKKYLAEYFTDELPKNPYVEDPKNILCVSVEPNGNVLGGNIYNQSIIEILNGYLPK